MSPTRDGPSASKSLSGGFVATCALIVVLVGLVYATQKHIDRTLGEYRSTEEVLYIENGELLKRVLVGFDSLAADVYWLRTVQYFGGKRLQLTQQELRPAGAAVAHHHDPRPQFQARLYLWLDVSVRAVSIRSRRALEGHRARRGGE